MKLGKDNLIPVSAFIGLVVILVLLAVLYFVFKQAKLSSAVYPLTWEKCVKDSRSRILESYPPRCLIPGIGSVVWSASNDY